MDLQVIEKMDGIICQFKSDRAIEGLAIAYKASTAIKQLRELLTPEFMAPIMELQGTRLGFRTDRDRPKDGTTPGYSMAVVKECLIEAVLMGLQPTGNQFNIIASNMYITKEGYGVLLKDIPALTWKIYPKTLPIKNGDASAAVTMQIEYTHEGRKGAQELKVPVKIDAYSSADQVNGKAERKARAWLHKTVTGSETPEGDVLDIDALTVKTTLKDETISHEDLLSIYDQKKALCSPQEQADASRILVNRETNSYTKLKKLLDGK